MPEEVLFKNETKLDRSAVAAYLRSVADSLEAGNPLIVKAGDQSLTLEPPAMVTFEVKAERETSKKSGKSKLSIEFEIEWPEGGEESGSDELVIE